MAKLSGEGSKGSPRATTIARDGDVLIQNDVVYSQPDRDTVSGPETGTAPDEQQPGATGGALVKPPPLLEEDTGGEHH